MKNTAAQSTLRSNLPEWRPLGWLPEFALLVLAAGVRLWRLDYHSVWFDEAVSLRWAASDPEYIWQTTLALVQEKHPPAYFLFLHYWQQALDWFGLAQNDAALRASGALLGVMTVWGIMLLATRLSGRGVGLLAGLLTALSPALVWYSQELRMFQPAATALVWAAYCLLRAWQARHFWVRYFWWAGLIATFLAAIYAYLFSAFLLPAAGLTLLALCWHGHPTELEAGTRAVRRSNYLRLFEGVLAFCFLTALFAPLATNAWLVNSAESTPGAPFANFGNVLWTQLRVHTIWRPIWGLDLENVLLALAGLLTLCGLTLRTRTRGRLDRAWLWLWIGIPLLVGGVLLATTEDLFGEDRYFLYLAPFVLWAIARGIFALAALPWRVGRPAAWASGAVMVLTMAAALPPLWTPSHARENWRAAIAAVVQEFDAAPGLRSTIISHVDYTHLPAEWYLRQQYTFDEFPLFFPFGGTLTPDQMESVVAPPLAGVQEAGFDTLWLLQSHLEGVDDARLVEGWLAERYPLLAEAYPAGIKLTGYAIRSVFDALPMLPDSAHHPNALAAPDVLLAACEITTPRAQAADQFLHPPSGRVHMRLWWQPQAPIASNWQPQVRVVNEQGVWGENLTRGGDALAMLPMSTWQPGQFVRHEVEINLNPATPRGTYPVTIALLAADGTPAADPITCGTVEILNEGDQ